MQPRRSVASDPLGDDAEQCGTTVCRSGLAGDGAEQDCGKGRGLHDQWRRP